MRTRKTFRDEREARADAELQHYAEGYSLFLDHLTGRTFHAAKGSNPSQATEILENPPNLDVLFSEISLYLQRQK